MPEIVEKAEAFATRKVGPLPVVAWIGIGVGGFVVFRLLTGGGGGGGNDPTGDIPFAPPAADGDDGSGGGGTVTTPPAPIGSTPPVPGTSGGTLKLTLAGRTPLYTTTGKLLGSGSSGTYAATKIRLLGQDFYRFKRAGKWTLVHVNAKTIKVS